ncbi:MAG: insulinase family protein [Chitinophagaceae bacterium]
MSNLFPRLGAALLLVAPHALSAQSGYQWKEATSAGYTYRYVSNDPLKARFYTLKNGLKVILSQNSKEPRIAVNIPVRTGSNNDPADHTGLAHYLEHLLFKGTDKFGSLDWTKEKPYLDKITELYAEYNKTPTTDTAGRKAKYHEIDSISGVASHYAIANEYDKLMANIGSQGTNAHTWVEETVYEENIPSNALDKFIQIQAERFRNPQFRLFHTELEAVYEEKNRGLDNDAWKVNETLLANVFPTSNYGQQTTIGTIEHLKNPSLIAIRNYYDKYYVPDNMAIVMAGDFNPDEAIKLIDKNFGYMAAKPVEDYQNPVEKPIVGPIAKDVYGPSAESVTIGYRIGKSESHEAMMADLIGQILDNGKAGLFDLNLNKTQKVAKSSAGPDQNKDYGVFELDGSPKQGQTLEEVKTLLLGQIDLLRKGQFDTSLIKAIVANNKLYKLKSLDNNDARVSFLMKDFIFSKGEKWPASVSEIDDMSKVTAKEIIDFANEIFKDNNYVVVYKHKGEDKNIVKVEKPAISPVETNAGKQSDFVKEMTSRELPPIQPKWIDYATTIQKRKVKNVGILYVPNKENSLFSLYYYYDFGSYSNKLLPLALTYLQYLGTDKYSAADVSRLFYAQAASFTASAAAESMTLSVSGLNENFGKAVSLFEDLLLHCKPDQEALAGLKNRLMKSRSDAKLNKGAIATAMRNYAMYGDKNPFNYVLSDKEIEDLTAEQLVNILHGLPKYKHRILYYGPQPLTTLAANVDKLHSLPTSWTATPKAIEYKKIQQHDNTVYFANYDMVQSEIFWYRTLDNFDTSKAAKVNVFNNYFGGNMGSVVFQTIREAKALAYSTYAFVIPPSKKEDQYGFLGYVGSQADKHDDAITAMNALIDTLPINQHNFVDAVGALRKDIETERITKTDILFQYLGLEKLGINYDIRKSYYKQYPTITMDQIKQYHDGELTQKPYSYFIVASDKKIEPSSLSNYGRVKVLTLEELFGY